MILKCVALREEKAARAAGLLYVKHPEQANPVGGDDWKGQRCHRQQWMYSGIGSKSSNYSKSLHAWLKCHSPEFKFQFHQEENEKKVY
jgi:hypothetical protein